MIKPVTFCIAGAGDRGRVYADYIADHPREARLVAVAEPRDFYRHDLASKHDIPAENAFETWQQLALHHAKLADAVIISTQDAMHVAPALALIEKGYDVLLEKPMAPTRQECEKVVEAVVSKQVIFGVCHVLRYTPYTHKLKQVIDSGLIGEVVSIQHLEPIGFDHFAHSFVRGNWRNENESNFMLMTKACHDMDWLRYIVGSKVNKVSSFGNLKYFKSDNKPIGAGDKCVDCVCESTCPYSAIKIYFERVKAGHRHWPVNTITSDVTIAGVQQAIQSGPYGRCVYHCDNDVVDHQVVNMEFESGATGVFTVTAFSEMRARQTRIFGTCGELFGDGTTIDHYDFLSGSHETIHVSSMADYAKTNGHGGGDYGLMKHFIEAVSTRDQGVILSGAAESLESYVSVFAAEESRRRNCVIEI